MWEEPQMLLVIFGAGASFDSWTPDSIERPPLAQDLVSHRFDRTSRNLPESQVIIDWLRRHMSPGEPTSLEEALARLIEESKDSELRRRQLIAFRFYLRRIICQAIGDWDEANHGYTRYLPLLSYLYSWGRKTSTPVLLATFNYDDLLEQAAERVLGDWQLSGNLDRYVERRDFRLFKLHGSTDWARESEPEDLARMALDEDLRDVVDPRALKAPSAWKCLRQR
jgi:hypothetical protein